MAAALATAAVGLHRAAESDVFWHLHQGRAVLRALSRVVPEPSAFPELALQTPVAAWLWDVTAYAAYRSGGFVALAWLTAGCALAAAGAVIWMVRAVAPEARLPAQWLISGLALACMTSRVRARPEVAALVMLPLLIGAAYRCSAQPRQFRYGATCVAVAVLWAQLHGSFLLALPIGCAVLLPALWQMRRDEPQRSALLAVLLGLLIAILTSTAGADLFAYAGEHASDDIKAHNAEMHAPLWSTFNPLDHVYGPIYLALALLGLYAAVRCAGSAADLALALLGLLVVTQSVRFLTIGAVLSAPLALRAADLLLREARRWVLVLAVGIACATPLLALQRALARAQANIGPLGKLGLMEHHLPIASARYLRTLPAGSRVLSTYDAGGSLGFWLDGHVRTFVDSRTMVLFDALQFALARDTFRSRSALQRAADRYGAHAITLARTEPICPAIDAPWIPVVIEPLWTTFVRVPDRRALQAVQPCGPEWLKPEACAKPDALAADIAALRRLQRTPLHDYLAAEGAFRCQHDAASARRMLPPLRAAEGIQRSVALLSAQVALAGQGGPEHFEALAPFAEQGDTEAWDVLRRALIVGRLASARLLPIARAAVARLDDQTPPALRELLAQLCIDAGDLSCVRFHGLRAALLGSPHARELLSWLAEHDSSEQGRAEASALRRVLAEQR